MCSRSSSPATSIRCCAPPSRGRCVRRSTVTPTPLLRLRRRALAVDAQPPPNPRPFSTALYAATTCEEAPLPWDRSTPPDPAERQRQAAARAATIPDSVFEPFDRATSLASDVLNLCGRWPTAPLAPEFGPGPLPDVPVLLLEGEDDLRTPVENAQRVGAQFPQSSLVVAPATGHSVLGTDFSGCSERAVKSFFREQPVVADCLNGRRFFKPTPPPPRRLSDVSPFGGSGRPGRTLGRGEADARGRGGGLGHRTDLRRRRHRPCPRRRPASGALPHRRAQHPHPRRRGVRPRRDGERTTRAFRRAQPARAAACERRRRPRAACCGCAAGGCVGVWVGARSALGSTPGARSAPWPRNGSIEGR